jgi:hypothetical protein
MVKIKMIKFHLKLMGYENDGLIFKRIADAVIENVVTNVTIDGAQRVIQ